jgi:hypothetical protein
MDRDLTKLAAISEAHYADLMGGQMKRFHDKYANAGDDLFVNFNPVISDPRDKTIYGAHMGWSWAARNATSPAFPKVPATHRTPDHKDPVGVYAYPASYVAKHWNDIAYGRGDGVNLRVLRLVAPPEKVLVLSDMNADRFFEAFARLRMEFNVEGEGTFVSWKRHDAARIYEAVSEYLITNKGAHHRVSNYSKVLWFLIQNKVLLIRNHKPDPDDENEDQEIEDDGYEGLLRMDPSYGHGRTREQNVQTQILLKGGYEAVLDRSGTSLEATIFHGEPEQILFLTKRAFEVVEVVKILHNHDLNDDSEASTEDLLKAVKSLTGIVAKQFNDRLAERIPMHILENPAFKELQSVRNYIATGIFAPTNRTADHFDHGFLTAKGRIILVSTFVGPKSEVVDKDARQREYSVAKEKAIYRSWDYEKQADPSDALTRYVMDMKNFHRHMGEFNNLIPEVFLVAEPDLPLYTVEHAKQRFDDLAQDLAQQFKISRKTTRWHAVTIQELNRYIAAAESYYRKQSGITATPDSAPPSKPRLQKKATAANVHSAG